MDKPLLLAAALSAALLPLAACGHKQPEVINTYDPQAAALRNAAPVQLPPSVTASKSYRCSDNSLFYVDFYSNNTAQIRTTRGGPPTELTQGDAGALAGGSFTLSGNGDHVTINGKTCHT